MGCRLLLPEKAFQMPLERGRTAVSAASFFRYCPGEIPYCFFKRFAEVRFGLETDVQRDG